MTYHIILAFNNLYNSYYVQKKTHAQRKGWAECKINEITKSTKWARFCPLLPLSMTGIVADVVASEAYSEPLKQVESFAKCCVIHGTLSLGVTVSIDARGDPVWHCILRFHNLDLHYLLTSTLKADFSRMRGVSTWHSIRQIIHYSQQSWLAIKFETIFIGAVFIHRGSDTDMS